MTKVYVVSQDAIADVEGEMLDYGRVVAVFTSSLSANHYIDNVEDTYYHRRTDYTVTEMDLED